MYPKSSPTPSQLSYEVLREKNVESSWQSSKTATSKKLTERQALEGNSPFEVLPQDDTLPDKKLRQESKKKKK